MPQTARDVLDQWVGGVNRGDAEGLIGLYAADCTLTPTFSPHTLRAPADIKAYFEQLASRRGLRVELHERSCKEQALTEQFRVISGVYSFQFEVDDVLLTFPSRFTFVVDLSSPTPIVHHHSSQVPRTLS